MYLLFTFLVSTAHANDQSLSRDDKKALEQSQEVLRDQEKRKEYIKKDKASQGADEFAKSVAGGDSATLDEIYSLAADIWAPIVEEAHGKPEEINKILLDAKDHPERFGNRFTPEQKKRLKELSEKIERSHKKP